MRIIVALLVFNILFSSFYPFIIYAREVEDAEGSWDTPAEESWSEPEPAQSDPVAEVPPESAPVYIEPDYQAIGEEPVPAETPAPVAENPYIPSDYQAIGEEQLPLAQTPTPYVCQDNCSQRFEVCQGNTFPDTCGNTCWGEMNCATPAPNPVPVIYDYDSQEGLMDQNQAQALQQQIQDQLDYSYSRQDQAPDITQLPDQAAETAGNIWGDAGQTINNVTAPVGNFFGGFFTPKQDTAALEKQIADLNSQERADSSPELKATEVAPTLSALGVEIQGDLLSGNFSIGLPQSCVNSDMNWELGLVSCNPGKGDPDAAFNAIKTAAESIDPTGILQILPQALALGEKKDEVDKLQEKAGIFKRLSELTGKPEVSYDPRARLALYPEDSVNVIDLLNEVIEEDRKLNPDETLPPEQVEARSEYAQKAEDYLKEEGRVTGEVIVGTVINAVGGKVIEGGVKVAGKAGAPVVRRLDEVLDSSGAKSFFSDTYDPTVGKLLRQSGEQKRENVARGTDDSVFVGLTKELEPKDEAKITLVDDINPEAASFASRVLGKNLDELASLDVMIADAWIRSGIPEDVIFTKVAQAQKLVEYLKSGKSWSRVSPEVQEAWQALRYEGSLNIRDGSGLNAIRSSPDDFISAAADALIKRKERMANPRIKILIDESNEKLKDAEDYIVNNLRGTKYAVKEAPYSMEADRVHIVNEAEMAELIGNRKTPGFASGQQIILEAESVLGDDFQEAMRITFHECGHTCDYRFRNSAKFNELGYKIGNENMPKLVEGATEFMTQIFSDDGIARVLMKTSGSLQELVDIGMGADVRWVYHDQVIMIHDKLIPSIIKNSSVPREQANAIVVAAVRNGEWEQLVNAVGGTKKVKDILDGTPSIGYSDYFTSPKRIITPADQSRALMAAAGILGVGGVAVGIPEVIDILSKPSPSPKPQSRIPFISISQVHAQENTDNSKTAAYSLTTFNTLVQKELIKQALEEEGNIDSEFVKDVLQKDDFISSFSEVLGSYNFVTGSLGTIEGEIEKDKYKIDIDSLADVDIQVPAVVDATANSSIVIPVSIKKGSGKVEKVLVNSGTGQNNDQALAKVKVVVVDNEGKILPWAGIKVRLTKVNQERKINLLAGWNLVTLTALPDQVLTAFSLLQQIVSQGGEATTVSTLVDGAWKTYVARGDKTYSGDDFQIEPGKAYFVKALKKSTLTFTGQALAAPIKLNLSSGWNAVGLPLMSKSYQASDLPSDTTARWESGLWDTFVKKDKEEYGNNFAIESNRGYVLKLDQERKFNP